MNKSILTLAIAAILVGCSGITLERCLQYREIYNRYREAVAAGEIVSPENIARADAAAEILLLTCDVIAISNVPETEGEQVTFDGKATDKIDANLKADQNGVPYLLFKD